MLTDKKDKPKEKQSRAKYKCSKQLETLIYITNRITDEGGLPEISFFSERVKEVFAEDLEIFSKEDYAEATTNEIIHYLLEQSEWLLLDLFKRVRQLTGETFEYSEGYFFSSLRFSNSFTNIYAGMKNDVDIFKRLAQVFNEVRKGIREKDNLGYLNFRATPLISANNEVIIESRSPIFDAVHLMDADRLRICEVCNHIFWAKKKNSFGCSESCVNALYQRRLRKENKIEINRQRREKYYKENGIAFCDKCVHPVTKCGCYLNERRKK
jgi:hypothetical protein